MNSPRLLGFKSIFGKTIPKSVAFQGTICLSCRSAHATQPHFNKKSKSANPSSDALNMRNIGIIAHIDAGKTSTTERMLYYVGYTNRIGNVDQGDTVTDFLKMERERGITIQSACIPMSWRSHRINLIDTPGHVDFTMEVERSLRVLDGAVTILDGVAGVEAQTQTVWNQANAYGIPRIAFINKMDRDGASFQRSVASMRLRLSRWGAPIPCQLPAYRSSTPDASLSVVDGSGSFDGVIDLIEFQYLQWKKNATGSVVERHDLITHPNGSTLVSASVKARIELVECLSEVDETIVDVFLEHDGDHMKVPADAIKAALRRATLKGHVVPVFCGAAFRNMGVQPLLDAIVDYLPSPSDRPMPVAVRPKDGTSAPISLSDSNMVALAFKIVHDQARGPLVFVRVYSGCLKPRAAVKVIQHSHSSSQSSSHSNDSVNSQERENHVLQEKIGRLYELYADDYEEIPHIDAGNIGAISGLKHVRTGDTLLLQNDIRGNLQLHTIDIPPPVFFRSIEVESLSQERELDLALNGLLREDPSLSVRTDKETGQKLLSGMGELHLEIAGDRLAEVYKVKCRLGPVQISFRESLADGAVLDYDYSYEKDVFGKKFKFDIGLRIQGLSTELSESQNTLASTFGSPIVHSKLTRSQIEIDNLTDSTQGSDFQALGFAPVQDYNQAVEQGFLHATSRGPILGYPISHVDIECTRIKLYTPDISSPAAARSAAQEAVRQLFEREKGDLGTLLEPMMEISIQVPQKYVGAVTKDVGGRRGYVSKVVSGGDVDDQQHGLQDQDFETCHLEAFAPLSELLGYASTLRSVTAGTGSFTMRLHTYQRVSSQRQDQIIKSARGY